MKSLKYPSWIKILLGHHLPRTQHENSNFVLMIWEFKVTQFFFLVQFEASPRSGKEDPHNGNSFHLNMKKDEHKPRNTINILLQN